MLVFHMEQAEWCKLQLKQSSSLMQPVIQGGACSVIPPKNTMAKDAFKTRKVIPLTFANLLSIFFSLIKSKTVFTILVASSMTVNLYPISSVTSDLSLSTVKLFRVSSSTLKLQVNRPVQDSGTQ